MMYYDRSLPEPILGLLREGEPLAWLVDLVRREPLAHLQFRRAHGRRKYGAIQLYFGRTSPLEIFGQGGTSVELSADPSYRDITPELFNRRLNHSSLDAAQFMIEEHLRKAKSKMTLGSFVDGEAKSHAGMMRRYGHSFRREDPFIAIDSEVRIGFDTLGEQRRFREEMLRLVGGETRNGLPSKLDALGTLPCGDIALVEVKAKGGDLIRAATQAAVHVSAFEFLLRQPSYDFSAVVSTFARQKVKVGLLPFAPPTIKCTPELVPVVASPDDDPEWLERWRNELSSVRTLFPRLLQALRFWRLSADGEILEEETP